MEAAGADTLQFSTSLANERKEKVRKDFSGAQQVDGTHIPGKMDGFFMVHLRFDRTGRRMRSW